jgi:hypothetical protein
MPVLTSLIAQPGIVLLVVLLAGLVVRDRLASCWAFGAYLLAILVSSLMILAAPGRF